MIPVRIEVIVLAAGRERLMFRAGHRPLTAGDEPDEVARAASGLEPAPDHLLHSTSWRHENGQVTLTYVAVPDLDPATQRWPVADAIARGDSGTDPSPDVDLAEVAAHACRHLAFLIATDPEVNKALSSHRDILALLRGYAPDVAGEA